MQTRLVVSCPGKAILTGEHAAVYSKAVVAATVDLRLRVFSQPTCDKLLSLNFIELGYIFVVPISTLSCIYGAIESLSHPGDIELLVRKLASDGKVSLPKNAQLASAIFVAIYLYCSILASSACSGLSLSIKSDIPLGAGLGSSAAYSAAMSASLLFHSYKFDRNTPGTDINALVNSWAFRAEQVVHGTPSGVDNCTVINGGFVKYSKGLPIETFYSGIPLQFLIVDTLVPKNTKTMVAKVAVDYNSDKPGVKSAIETIDSISNSLYGILKQTIHLPSSGTHPQQIELNMCQDQIATLITKNQDQLEFLGVSHNSLDNIVRAAGGCGYSAKLTGGGGGGCALVFVPQTKSDPDSLDTLKSAIEAYGYRIYSTKMGVSGLEIDFDGSSWTDPL
ncbi:hypothetical protein BB561_006081 [Smittium simulii]|uniref:Mevalonate kinase n=1 Tax=Smittium simulii TaxID=133385 RepID=A0A2T9Y6N2_9FUNG|nr:hypothetical protein BB561_006081 [Smittium simulii]